jgi:hypothetical protein
MCVEWARIMETLIINTYLAHYLFADGAVYAGVPDTYKEGARQLTGEDRVLWWSYDFFVIKLKSINNL